MKPTSFFNSLLGLHKESQVIIVENEHPPAFVSAASNVVVFTKNVHQGRYGFFPVTSVRSVVGRNARSSGTSG